MTALWESARAATDTYSTYSDAPPRLVPIGIRAIDRVIGGLGPGTRAVIGALDGVGKSSLALSAGFAADQLGYPPGIVSLEDPPDVVGSRALGLVSGVDSLRIRRKELNEDELDRLRQAEERLRASNVRVEYALGGSVDQVVAAMRRLVADGARSVWVDYVHALPGAEDNSTLASSLGALHGAAAALDVPLILLAQLTPRQDPKTGAWLREPRISWLRGSGALRFGSRATVLLWKAEGRVEGVLAKSTFGGEGQRFALVRDSSGTLREVGAVEEVEF